MATAFSSKTHTLPSGRTMSVQGYEGLAIDHLLFREGIAEDDIVVDPRKMPKYHYTGVDGAIHRYLPDIWIPARNLIVEVKSSYTYLMALENNKLKAQAVRDARQLYRLMVMHPQGFPLSDDEVLQLESKKNEESSIAVTAGTASSTPSVDLPG